MKLSLRTLLLSSIALTMSLLAQADSMCGDGHWDPVLNLCQGGAGAGVYYPGQGNNSQQHTPRDYYGAIAADVVNGEQAHESNNYTSASAAKQAALKGCALSTCKLIIAYKNGCGATASSTLNHVVGGIGDSPEEAEDNAMDKCEQTKSGGNCHIWSRGSCSYYQ